MKTKLFIDFDGTLFDTSKFREAIWDLLSEYGFSKEALLGSYREECLDYKFSLNNYLKRLLEIRKFNIEEAKNKIEELYLSIPQKFLYADVERLGEIDHMKFQPILISLGDPYFQRKKVDSSGLLKYFEKVCFIELQKWEYLKKVVSLDEKFCIIDDRGDTISQIAKEFPNVIAIEIDRRSHETKDPVRQIGRFQNLKANDLTRALRMLE